MQNLTDIEIIESIKKGNHSDYAILIDKYKDRAFSLLSRMIKNEMEAEEVLQDCFLRAFYALNNFRNDSKFSTWFYRIVYNTALTKLSTKKRKIENEMYSIDELKNLKSETDYKETEKKDISKFVNELIDRLPPNYSSVINMFYLDGMTCKEISEVMGLSFSNVKVILYRARNALKDILVQNDFEKELL